MIRHSVVLAAGAALLATSCAREPKTELAEASPTETALAVSPLDSSIGWGPCPALFPAGCEIAVLHGDPAAPNADVFLRVPSQYEIPAHWHSSAERMALVTGELEVTYQGQQPATLKIGDYAYGPAKLPHAAVCASSDACTLFIAFEGAVDAHAFDGSLEDSVSP